VKESRREWDSRCEGVAAGVGVGSGSREWESGVGVGSGSREWEAGVGVGSGNREWESGAGVGTDWESGIGWSSKKKCVSELP
jgi:hypothetical protein